MSKSFVIGFLKTAIGAAALAYVIWKFWEPANGGRGIKNLLGQTPDFVYLALMCLLTAATIGCQILRWYMLVRALDLPFSIRNAFRLGMVGYFFNTLLPGSIGGDLMKAYFIAREQPARQTAAIATVLVDRLLGLFGLLLFASLFGGAYWLSGDPRIAGNAYLTNIVIVSSILLGIAVVVWIIMGFIPVARLQKIETDFLKVKYIGKTLSEVWGAVAIYRQRPKLLYLTLPLTAFSQAMMVLYFHLAVRVFPNVGVGSLGEHFIIGPIGFIAQVFFPAPGGVGGAEAIFGYLYTLIQQPEETGAIGRLTMRLAEIGLGVLGYLVYISMKAELPVPEAEKAAEHETQVASVPT